MNKMPFRCEHESFPCQRSQLNSADIIAHGRYSERKPPSSRSEEIKQISFLNKRLHAITKMDGKKTSRRSNVQKRGSKDDKKRTGFANKSRSDNNSGYSLTQKSGSDRNIRSDFSRKFSSDRRIHSDFSRSDKEKNTAIVGCSELICSSEDSRRRVAFTSKSKSDSKIGYSSGSDKNIHSKFSRSGEDKNTETTAGCSDSICCSKDSRRRVAFTSKSISDSKIGYISGSDRNLGLDFSSKLCSAKSIHSDFPTSAKDKAEIITRCPDSIYSPEDSRRRVAVTSKFCSDKIVCSSGSDGHNCSDFLWNGKDKNTEIVACSESIYSSRDRRVAFTNKSSSDRKIGYDFMRKLESDHNVASDFLQTFRSERNIYSDFSSNVNESMGRNNLAAKGHDNDKSQTSIANSNRTEEYDTFENQLNSQHRIRAIPTRRTMALYRKTCSDDQLKRIANKINQDNKKVQWKLDDNKFLWYSAGPFDEIEVPHGCFVHDSKIGESESETEPLTGSGLLSQLKIAL